MIHIVTAENRIHLQAVTLGVDTGTEVQVTAGLTGDESIALGLGQTVSEGLKVKPVARKEPGGPAPSAPPAASPERPAPAPARPAAEPPK